jgi:phosphoribosylpyrophosphate synthetase
MDTIPQIPQGTVFGVTLTTEGKTSASATTKIRTLSVAPLFAKAILAVQNNESISALFV